MSITQQRKIAKERIVEQFGESLKSAGLLVVDCGDVGTAVVNQRSGHWRSVLRDSMG